MSRSEELRALAQRIADSFPPEVVEVVLTGSVSRGVADEVSDIEMLCVTEEQLSLEQAFELARRAGLEERDSWGDPATPTRRVFGYLERQPVETIWWSRELAEESFVSGGSAEALASGVALRTSGLLASWQERLADYSDELAAERIEKAAERWGGFAPAGLLTIVRPDCALARMEWMVEGAQRVLAIVFALNRVHQPTTKRLAARLEPLAVKPERLAERIDEAVAEPDPRTALRLLTELQLETVRLAPSGTNVDRARAWLAKALEILAVLTLAVLVLTACGSGKRSVSARYSSIPVAASHVSHDCAPRDDPSSDVNGLLWLRGGRRPLVYYRNDALQKARLYSSSGRVFRLWGVFWPCNPPVTIYGRPFIPGTLMTVLSSQGQLRTIKLGRFRLAGGSSRDSLAGYGNAIVGAQGRLIFFDGTKIRYAGGAEFTVPGLPHGWQVERLAVSPRDSSVFLAGVESQPGPEGCRGDVKGAIYLITPERSTKLRSYDACTSPLITEWSPDSREILWFLTGGKTNSLFVSDGRGRHFRPLVRRNVSGAIWSPDGRTVAYGYGKHIGVIGMSTGNRRFIGRGELGAWSPDGREIALVEEGPPTASGNYPGGSVVAVPVAGGHPRLLIKLPAVKTP